jgi:hypothetical protein
MESLFIFAAQQLYFRAAQLFSYAMWAGQAQED